MKICTKCKGAKPLDAFAADRSKKDGRKAQCKECIADRARDNYSSAKRSRAYYAASPQTRSRRTIRQRNSRWNTLALKHGEHWLIEQVQSLKASRRLSAEAIFRCEEDGRLAAFFRTARLTSVDKLRAALGSEAWDRVRGMPMTRAEFVARTAPGLTAARGERAAKLRTFVEKRWAAYGIRPIRDEFDGPEICQNAPTRREQLRAASDRILRKK